MTSDFLSLLRHPPISDLSAFGIIAASQGKKRDCRLTDPNEIDAYELTRARSSTLSVGAGVEARGKGLSSLESSRHWPHGVALSCKWSLADSYPDIDKFTRGVERLFAEIHFAYPAHSEQWDEWSRLSRDHCIHQQFLHEQKERERERRGKRGKSLREKIVQSDRPRCWDSFISVSE